MNKIYSLWIDGPLHPVNHLCAASCKNFRHELIIYSYSPLEIDAEVRDAREILPENEIYYYKNFGHKFKYGGIAEKLKASMLYNLGEMHIDLDVVLLDALNYEQEYVFRPHNKGVVANVIKAPKHSLLALKYLTGTKSINENNTDWEASFSFLNDYIEKYNLRQFILSEKELGKDIPEYWWDFLHTEKIPDKELKLIHFCGCIADFENALPNSYYNTLLNKYGIK
jgi:hypothetical protein